MPNKHVARMLEHALAEDLALLPFLVLGFFSGIRPDGELQKIDWSDVHLTDRTVVIRSETAPDESRIYFQERIRLKRGFQSNEAPPIPLARRPRVLRRFWPAPHFRHT